MNRTISVMAMMLTLTACGKPSQPATTTAPAATSSVTRQANALVTLRGLSEGARNAVLFRAITDAQASCSKVVSSAYQQDYEQMAMFVAKCPSAAPFAVFISANGYAQVRPCSTLAEDAPKCRAIS